MRPLTLVFLSAFVVGGTLRAENPIVREKYTADPAALVHDGKVYLYAGHDEEPVGGPEGYLLNEWLCYSSKDMVTWKDEGAILRATDFAWASGEAWASQVIERDGKFYFYATVAHRSIFGKAIGVAVSDSPTGPFVDAIGSALITNTMTTNVNSSWDDIDPTVFIDDDGQAYLFWGNTSCKWVKLKDNMVEVEGEIHYLTNLPSFTEAPWIHKKGDWYYLSYAYGWEEEIAYAMSRSIEGPWEFKGVLNLHVDNCNTNHQSIIEFQGKDYFIYHNGALPDGGSFRRSVCVDRLFYKEDGTLEQIVMTSGGVQPANDGIFAVFDTSLGSFTAQLFPEEAPLAVSSFVGLAEGTGMRWVGEELDETGSPYFTDSLFHKVVAGAYVQGGALAGVSGQGPGYLFEDEVCSVVSHGSGGILAMAGEGPNSNGSEFLVTLAEQSQFGGKHTVMGQVRTGMSVVDAIGAVATDGEGRPVEDVVLDSVTIVRQGAEAVAFDASAAGIPAVSRIKAQVVEDSDRGLAVAFRCREQSRYELASSSDLETWSAAALPVINEGGSSRRIEVAGDFEEGGSARFFRVNEIHGARRLDKSGTEMRIGGHDGNLVKVVSIVFGEDGTALWSVEGEEAASVAYLWYELSAERSQVELRFDLDAEVPVVQYFLDWQGEEAGRVLVSDWMADLRYEGTFSADPESYEAPRFRGNPIETDLFTADPSPMVSGDTLYIYTGHDIQNETDRFFKMDDWYVFFTTDMVNYEKLGPLLTVGDFAWAKGDAFASHCIERDGKFYWYVAIRHKDVRVNEGFAIGVAVSDSPTGPFTDAIGAALITDATPNSIVLNIDPAVYIDDDGQAYLYWGSWNAGRWVKLKENMLELEGEVQTLVAHNFFEAPFIHKRDDIYYLTYASGYPSTTEYSTGPSATGPWTYRGVINDLLPKSETNHQGVVEFKGQWYFIYHTAGLPTGGVYRRSVCVDKLEYDEQGLIKKVRRTLTSVPGL